MLLTFANKTTMQSEGMPPMGDNDQRKPGQQYQYGPITFDRLTGQVVGLAPFAQDVPGSTQLQLATMMSQQGQEYGLGQVMSPVKSIGGVAVVEGDPSKEMLHFAADEGVQETLSEEVFSKYHSRDLIPGAQIHPGDIVEAASLAAIALPVATYNLAASIPREIIVNGKLSQLQIEGILYASQRHQTILPNGSRGGCFIGDAAGVGKGRQIAGIILDNYARGRTKHIWFSISADLKVDAQRDIHDIGCHIKVIEGCQQLDKETRVFGLSKDFQQGVVFSTYATLVSSTQKGGAWATSRKSRLDQLIKWCGAETFSGCLVFDECHKAKHFIPGNEDRSTKIAVAVATIQRMLPNARVLYCSATGVSDVKNMAFMERLGIWGEGASFKSFEHFLEAINRRGLGVAEMLAMEMKASGMYLSRGLSFKQAEFVTIEMNLTEEQMKMYDMAAHVWNELKNSLEAAVGRTNTSSPRVWSYYWASHQRFFKQLCMGVKVPKIIEEAKQALQDGYCVVIGLQTTGEASMDSELLCSDNDCSEFVSVAREILLRFISTHFPTTLISNEEAPREDPWSLTAKTMLLDFAKKIPLPNSPLDDIIDQLGGTTSVAEMTGRRGRMVRDRPNSSVRYQHRSPTDSDDVNSMNVQERNSFMSGKKLVAIISDAASTGISLHADVRVENQRRRLHLTIELPWSADKAVQQMGRSHRSNQTSGPLYKLLTTNLGGERRFAASVARRLQTLGALTQGDRRAATGADLSQFNFDTPYGRTALRTMYTSICNNVLAPGVSLPAILPSQANMDFVELNQTLKESISLMGVVESYGIIRRVADKDSRDVSKFLNRILGLHVINQNLIFNYFSECLQSAVAMAKKEGKYTEGLVDINASSVEMVSPPKTVFKEAKTSTPTQLLSLLVDRGLSWKAAVERYQRFTGKHDNFYISKREQYGKRLYILATQLENSTHLFKIARPNTGVSNYDEESGDLHLRYKPLSKEEAEEGWKEQYEATREKCIHGTHCHNPSSCSIGARLQQMDLLCGGIVTLLSTLETTAAKHAHKLGLSKSSYSMRVVRVALSNDRRVIGIRYPESLVQIAEEALREHKVIEALQVTLKQNASAGSLGHHVTPADLCQQSNLSTIEPESPVNPKLLKKAITPPITLNMFFKPIPRFDNTESQGLQLVTEAKEDSSSTSAGKKYSRGKRGKRKSWPSEGKSESCQDNEDTGSDCCVILDNETTPEESNGTAQKPQPITATGQILKCDDPLDIVETKNTCTFDAMCGSLGTKRPLQDSNGHQGAKSCCQPATKKSKSTSAGASTSGMACPICNKSFRWITQLNRHLDSCLLKA